MGMDVVNEVLEDMKNDIRELHHRPNYQGITDEQFTMTAISALVSLLVSTSLQIIAKEIDDKLRGVL